MYSRCLSRTYPVPRDGHFTIMETTSSASIANIEKGQRIMAKDLKKMGLKPTSYDYALNCLDPFHDLSMKVEGFPDSNGEKSIVQTIVRQITIAKPTGAPAGNWDCHLSINPTITGVQASGLNNPDEYFYPVVLGSPPIAGALGSTQGDIVLPLLSTAGAAPVYTNYNTATNVIPGGLLQVCSVGNGLDTFSPIQEAFYTSINIADVFDTNVNSRVIGIGFEVHNVTPELNIGGTVLCYKNNESPDDVALFDGFNVARTTIYDQDAFTTGYGPHNSTVGNVYNIGPVLHKRRRLPPTQVSDAAQLESKTWNAKFGCLVPVCIDYAQGLPTKRPSGCATLQMHSKTLTSITALNTTSTGAGMRPFGAGSSVAISGVDVATSEVNTAYLSSVSSYTTTSFAAVPYINRTVQVPTPTLELPLVRSGAYFTGLDSATSLTIVLRVFVEQFPNPGSVFMPLASPSPPYDPNLVPLLMQVGATLAPAYPVSMNAEGDFFDVVVKGIGRIARDFLTHAMPIMGGPLAQTIQSYVAPIWDRINNNNGNKTVEKGQNRGQESNRTLAITSGKKSVPTIVIKGAKLNKK